MNLSQLTIRDLEYLVTTAEFLHFGQAARKLGVGQPTLSEQIKKFEIQLNIVIFERTNRTVHLTAKGREIISMAKDIILKAQVLINYSTSSQGLLEGEFKLGAIATVGPYYFPYVLKEIKKAFPKLILIIEEGHTDQLLKKLTDGELDAVIASRTFNENRFRIFHLYHEPFYFVYSKSYHHQFKDMISIHDIPKDDLLLLTEGNCLKDETLDLCSLSTQSKGKLQAAGLETLKQLVVNDLGVALIPALARYSHPKIEKLLSYSKIKEKNAGREIVLTTREEYARPEQIRLLLSKLRPISLQADLQK